MNAVRAQLTAKPSIMAQVAESMRLGREAAERNHAADLEAGTPRTFTTRTVRAN